MGTPTDEGVSSVAAALGSALNLNAKASKTDNPVDAESGSLFAALRDVLPLPRELRDQIYGYLLHHDHVHAERWSARPSSRKGAYSVKAGRDRNVAQTYRFETGILGVNKQTRKEALQILESNLFVVVSFEWDSLEIGKHVASVPIVSENQKDVAQFHLHCLRVHIRSPFEDRATMRIKSFIMVSADLPEFVQLMAWTYLSMLWPTTTVVNLQSPPVPMRPELLGIRPKKNSTPKAITKIQLIPSSGGPISLALEHELLRPFEKLIAGQHKVTILNCSNSPTIAALKARMGPSIVFLTPLAWHVLDVAKDIKQAGDELVASGELLGAADKYGLMVFMTPLLFQLPPLAYTSDSGVIIGVAQRLLMDAAATAGFLAIRTGNFDSLNGALRLSDLLSVMYAFLDSLPSRDVLLPDKGRRLPCYQGIV